MQMGEAAGSEEEAAHKAGHCQSWRPATTSRLLIESIRISTAVVSNGSLVEERGEYRGERTAASGVSGTFVQASGRRFNTGIEAASEEGALGKRGCGSSPIRLLTGGMGGGGGD